LERANGSIGGYEAIEPACNQQSNMRLVATLLVFCVGSLLALGIVMLYSSGMMQVGASYMVKQAIWSALGLALGISAAAIDYRHLKKLAWGLLVVAVILLVLVLLPGVGTKINGSRRWFALGFMNFQPSELAKIAVIMALAHYCDRYQRKMGTLSKGIVWPAVFIGLVMALVFLEPDYGTTLLLGAVSGTMLIVAGVRWRFLIPPALAGLVAFGFFIWHNPVRLKRIFSWLYLEEYKQQTGYQAYQAMLALGSGGWMGLGLGNSRQKSGFVPEHHTDFILCIIGEELGLIATLGIVLAFLMIVFSGIHIARHARDSFGMLLASGITFLIGFQAFINIGVVTSALPNKGLSLPFISYGGSNLLLMLTCVGLLLSVGRKGVDRSNKVTETLAERDDFAPQLS
jgi:cell division protein FtsW